ncbi:MAG: hypothetical protein BWZ11_01356 [Bacteroidetes bacterium ADurb.BinA395]|nr:MAG: hypothetical protein BWZ11_01356 [Bacteroidetes bacterium ADurb.BinA395]
MLVIDISFKFSRTNFHKSNTTPMIGIHIGVNLENKTRKSFLVRIYNSLVSLNGLRRRSYFHEAIQQFLHSEIVQSAAKKNRSQLSRQIFFPVESRIYSMYEFQILPQLACIFLSNELFKLLTVNIRNLNGFSDRLLIGGVKLKIFLVNIINSLK